MLGDEELGTSPLDAMDEGMAIAGGSFRPSAGYAKVATLFRRLSDAMEARADLSELYAARDALNLTLLDSEGLSLPIEFVTVHDFGDELDRELEVKLADLVAWSRARSRVSVG